MTRAATGGRGALIEGHKWDLSKVDSGKFHRQMCATNAGKQGVGGVGPVIGDGALPPASVATTNDARRSRGAGGLSGNEVYYAA